MPYVICDTDGHPVTPPDAKAIIAEHWTVPTEVRARRRSKKKGKAPKPPEPGGINGATFPRHSIVDQHHRHGQQTPHRRTA
ncbi:MAG: hypothetical protein U5K30_03115 [Acidimicrobiales bacterium]|nr:hypothetical protein [Acidimicrobiales bacterium]